ncbi:MAG: flagellar motor switch protein FliN [bacterium]|nr:flagellar motor switch protein FliN [bacterium]
MNDVNSKQLRQIGGQNARKMEEVFSAIVGKRVTVQESETQAASASLVELEFPNGLVTVRAPGDGIPGEMMFWYAPEGAAAIVDLMIMGDGNVPFRPEEHLDGIAEASHQLIDSLAIDWTNAGLPVSFQQVSATMEEDPGAYVAAYEHQTILRLDVSIDSFGDLGLWLYLSSEVVQLLNPPQAASTRPSRAQSDAGKSKTGQMVNVRPAVFAPFENQTDNSDGEPRNLELLLDVSLPITIELGRTSMLIRDVLELGPGSVVELDKLSGEPVDLYVNDKKFAKGEVVVVDENFGVRITELMRLEDRLKSLRG